jgi:cytochrome c biogenesis protein CcmG, thiol:disulfide interchange protein DsbE
MNNNNSSKKNLFISGIVLVFFLSLMIYALKQDPNFNPSQLVGEKAPAISASIAQGGTFHSSDTFNEGRWVIVNFWSSFCYVCRGEAPEIENFYQTVSLKNKRNPNFISINIQDDKETIDQWQRDYKQTIPVIQDIKGLISIRYGVTGTPETFFIDPNSIVRYRVAGALNKRIILNFISWLEKNPNVSQDKATKALMNMRSNS